MTSHASYLYVEDDRLSRDVMQMLMQDVIGVSEYTVFGHSGDFINRVKALATVPDFFFLDIHVTPLTGFQMLDLIRAEQEFNACRVIALTASVMNEEVQQLRQAGFDGAIGKPLDALIFPELIARLEQGDSVWQIT